MTAEKQQRGLQGSVRMAGKMDKLGRRVKLDREFP
jgi:hypothetical protein